MSVVALSVHSPPCSATTSLRDWSHTCSESTRTPSRSKMTAHARECEPWASTLSEASRQASFAANCVEHGADGGVGFGAATTGGEHVALGRFSGQGNDGDTRRRDAVRQPGHERDPQVSGHEPHHRLPVARAVGDPRRVARALAPGHEHLVARPPDGRRDPLRVAQLREVDRVPVRQRMVEREDGVEDVAEQVLAVVARIIRARSGAALHRQDHVHLAGREQHHRLVGLRLQHAQLELRRALAQRPGGGRQQAGERGREAADADLAARRGVLPCELALHPLDLGEQRVRVAQQDVRGGREPHRAPVRLQDGVADLALEPRELLRDRT